MGGRGVQIIVTQKVSAIVKKHSFLNWLSGHLAILIDHDQNVKFETFSGLRGERPGWPPPTWPSFENLPRSRGENISIYPRL